ncbi:hypothetical protein P4V88_22435 [Bacillus thuringiensis]|uniref:hypothetical protein n=1 Tax=Bacillus thuringiensis TaxID=1428 RepID=UPI000A3737EF|nr:hypothetical protein [Bacillus thuringiensis]MED2125000.1 hypothetical protein [Bacillus thuringiensis]MED2150152.1 hypothetical protein [Bacillus thuringiensis]MED2174691.1 hypothetical protein [Bacillus thuringiensis]MED2479050.1 hypothetical protein [Bacillus thuringiensis]MED2573826.1 hypothetical protein [Bacillus thuringiensis]
MKLEIEKFISEIEFPEAAMGLIEEGILCYKAGAYRSAYIMSYLFFLSVVKHRALESSYAPIGYGRERKKKTDEIPNDEFWERKVFDLITTGKSHSCYFEVSELIITQMEYWRTLRHECVLSKGNQFVAVHVESFWLFLQTTLPELLINCRKNVLSREAEEILENLFEWDKK